MNSQLVIIFPALNRQLHALTHILYQINSQSQTVGKFGILEQSRGSHLSAFQLVGWGDANKSDLFTFDLRAKNFDSSLDPLLTSQSVLNNSSILHGSQIPRPKKVWRSGFTNQSFTIQADRPRAVQLLQLIQIFTTTTVTKQHKHSKQLEWSQSIKLVEGLYLA